MPPKYSPFLSLALYKIPAMQCIFIQGMLSSFCVFAEMVLWGGNVQSVHTADSSAPCSMSEGWDRRKFHELIFPIIAYLSSPEI